jgi:hypothetical protein
MSVNSYTRLREIITTKNRGRKNEYLVAKQPEIWAKMFGGDIGFWAYSTRVGTLRPDNSMTVTVNGYHTPSSCKIINALTVLFVYMRKGRIWVNDGPIQGDKVELDANLFYIVPDAVAKFRSDVQLRQQAVHLSDMTPPDRLRLEMKVWSPTPALSAKCKEYLRGKLPKDKLSGRDIYTLCDHVFMQNAMPKMMEDLL